MPPPTGLHIAISPPPLLGQILKETLAALYLQERGHARSGNNTEQN